MLENDVDHKINKLSPEPSVSKQCLALNRVKYHGNLWVLDSLVILPTTRPRSAQFDWRS